MKKTLLRGVTLTAIAAGLFAQTGHIAAGGDTSLQSDTLTVTGSHLAANIQSLAALPEPSSIVILGTALFLLSKFGNRRLLRRR